MKLLPGSLLTVMILATASSALAASSVDLAVKGLITPSACAPTLSNGGTVDYGKISAKDLVIDNMTHLEPRTVSFTITCEAATLIALQGQDNRAGSEYIGNGRLFGLGLVNGNEKLGDYGFYLKNLLADGSASRVIRSKDNGATWAAANFMAPDFLMSVADDTTLSPIAVQVLSGDLELDTWIAPAEELTLGHELPIDGLATLKVHYL